MTGVRYLSNEGLQIFFCNSSSSDLSPAQKSPAVQVCLFLR